MLAGLQRSGYAWTAHALRALEPGEVGRRGEQLCVELLESRGYRVVAQRLKTPHGEVDVVARCGANLWCIEVKSTRASPAASARGFAPGARLSRRQRGRLQRAAADCARTLNESAAPGLALIEVWLDGYGRAADWRVTRLRAPARA